MLLFIIRHGDPIYDPDQLTPLGELQARAVAKRFAVHGLDRIYTSPLNRARQTARPTCEMLGMTAQVEDWMSEKKLWDEIAVPGPDGGVHWPFHAVENTAWFRSAENADLGDRWIELDIFKKMRETGAWERIIRCSDEFLARQGYVREGTVYRAVRPNDDRVAAFCHQGFGNTWLSHLLHVPPHLYWTSFDMSHSGVMVIELRNRPGGITVPQCLQMSDLSHILLEGLPYRFQNRVDL